MTSFEKTAKKIIAKTMIGSEYIYNKFDTYQVSKANADNICAAMNKALYQLKPGEIWKVYTVSDYTYKRTMYKLIIRNNKIRVYQNLTVYT